jgi:hypothetical protein
MKTTLYAMTALMLLAGPTTAEARPTAKTRTAKRRISPKRATTMFQKRIAPTLVKALNRTQNLTLWRSGLTRTDYRVGAQDFKGRVRLHRAPKQDRAGLKAYVFGVRAQTDHVRSYDTRQGVNRKIVATANRSVVGVALFDKKGNVILDGGNLRVRRTDPGPSLHILFGGPAPKAKK